MFATVRHVTRAEVPHELLARVRPLVQAGERVLPVAGALGRALPHGGVQRGATVVVGGRRGAGLTTTALALAAAATAAGEWAAVVDPDGTLGARAAAEVGIDLDRCAVVRRVAPERWATVVGALLDGVALVAATVPARLRTGDARRLIAKARERASVLVAVGSWPAEAALRLHVEPGAWPCTSSGLLGHRDIAVHVDGRGVRRSVLTGLARTG